MNVQGIDATYYWAQDLDRATAFYTALLGSPPTNAMADVFAEWTFADDTSFGLYKGQEFRASDGVMFHVADVPGVVAMLRARGVEIDPHVEETPVCKMAFGKDSEGNGFILHRRNDA